MSYGFSFEKCSHCGREMLVERQLIGVDHTISILVSCKECLRKRGCQEEFREKFPEKAKVIDEWLEKGEIKYERRGICGS